MCKTSDNGKLAWSNGYLGCLLEEPYKDHGLEEQRNIVGSGRRRLVETVPYFQWEIRFR
jgi:hypothetical protein